MSHQEIYNLIIGVFFVLVFLPLIALFFTKEASVLFNDIFSVLKKKSSSLLKHNIKEINMILSIDQDLGLSIPNFCRIKKIDNFKIILEDYEMIREELEEVGSSFNMKNQNFTILKSPDNEYQVKNSRRKTSRHLDINIATC